MKLPRKIVLGPIVALCLTIVPMRSLAQAPQAVQRITTAIDSQNLTILHGNVHPLARGEFDQGAVADAQVLHRVLLLLQRSPEQEAALQQLLSDQQGRSSGRFQSWLTPEQFGAQFGPADADIQTVTQWLTSQGFSDVVVGAGRTTIEFSGTAGQVRNAFHTEIRKYSVQGKMHFANASDPAIPAALAPVVAGVVSLNNFPIRSHLQRLGTFEKSLKTGVTRPLFTFPGCGSNCYGVGPADFAKIYNTQPLLSGSPKIDGTGQGIAVVGESNIRVQDITGFRAMFGLTQNFSASNVIVNGVDPGITDSEDEADLDVQWSGAVAPGARIDFVTSESTETTPGISLSAIYIVDHNLDAVLSESFGACEKTVGTTQNQFLNALWEQASAQGITVVISAGDNGSAGCDDFNTAQTATQGLAVSGFASTPYNVAVGGTDFDQASNASTYWNTAPTSDTTLPTPASAKSYIPEVPWNDTCAQTGLGGCTANNIDGIAAGSGGVSTLYTKPLWQSGKGVPVDGHRDIPDVSLFAGNGFNGSFYIICQSDVQNVPCGLTDFTATFQGVGGTSASAPAFAGIMALVNQKLATGPNPAPRQGNANYFLYALAQQQVTANLSCNSSSSPAATCSFHDVTKSNDDVPCTGASTNCSSKVVSIPGVLVQAGAPTTPAFTTTAGYDLASGLGSLNAQNIVNKWSTVNTTASTTTLTLNAGAAVNITHGQTVPYLISVGPATASGDASLIATPSGSTTGIGPFPLTGGVATGTTAQLPGGASYNVVAHYEGNGTVAPSNSAPVTVTVAAEPSKVFVTVPTFNPETGQQTGTSPTSVVYGSPYILRADVTNATGSLSALCKPPSCPSGTIMFADTIGGVGQGAPNSGTFSLNSSGFTEDQPVQFPGGNNVITATYSGDGSFSAPASPTTYNLTVTPAPTQGAAPNIAGNGGPVGTAIAIFVNVTSNVLTGAAPGGTIVLYDGATPLATPVSTTSSAGNSSQGASISGVATPSFSTPGNHAITAHYSGDANYAASVSPAATAGIKYTTLISDTATPTSINLGQSVTVNVTVTTTVTSPAITGSFNIPDQNVSFPGVASVDVNGNQTLTGTTTYTPNQSGQFDVVYSGDTNYFGNTAAGFVTVIIPDFSLALNPTSVTLSSGQENATLNLSVSAVNSLPTSATLACIASGIFQAGCTFSPSKVTPTLGQPASVKVSLIADGSAPATPNAKKVAAKRRGIVFVGWPRTWWGTGLAALAFAMFAGSLWPSPKRRVQRRLVYAACTVMIVAIGCGGGSSSSSGGGDSGGGGSTSLADTTITVTLPNSKVGQFSPVNAQATVTSSKPVSGSVTFFAVNGSAISNPIPLAGGSASAQLSLAQIGFYKIYATYSGDAENKASQSANVPLTVTGTSVVNVAGFNSLTNHEVEFTVTIQ